MSKVSALITHKSVCTGPMRLSHAITCPFSKYFQIFSNFVQNFKHFALFLPLLNIFLSFLWPFSEKSHAGRYFLEQVLVYVFMYASFRCWHNAKKGKALFQGKARLSFFVNYLKSETIFPQSPNILPNSQYHTQV